MRVENTTHPLKIFINYKHIFFSRRRTNGYFPYNMTTQPPISKAGLVFQNMIKGSDSDAAPKKQTQTVQPAKKVPQKTESSIPSTITNEEDSLFSSNSNDESEGSEVSDEELEQVLSEIEDNKKKGEGNQADDSIKRPPTEPYNVFGKVELEHVNGMKEIRVITLNSNPQEKYIVLKDLQPFLEITPSHTSKFQNEKKSVVIDKRSSTALNINAVIDILQRRLAHHAVSGEIIKAICKKFPDIKIANPPPALPAKQKAEKTQTQAPVTKKKPASDPIPVSPTKKPKLSAESTQTQRVSNKDNNATKEPVLKPVRPAQVLVHATPLHSNGNTSTRQGDKKKQVVMLVDTTFDILDTITAQNIFHKKVMQLCTEVQFQKS